MRFSAVGIFVLLSAGLVACDPIHSVGVSGILSEPLERECILQALRDDGRIANTSVREPVSRKVWNLGDGADEEITSAQYIVESTEPVGGHKISGHVGQWQDKQQVMHFYSGNSWLGPKPPPEVQQQTQVFSAYLAHRISQFCKAQFRESLKCTPEDKACEAELSEAEQNGTF